MNSKKHFCRYKISIQVDRAEADDIIGTLCNRFGKMKTKDDIKILIISGDKDFAQLQKYANVEQYSKNKEMDSHK